MCNPAIFMVVVLGLFGLQCRKSETPAPVPGKPAQGESSPAKDVVRLPDAVCKAVGIEVEKVTSRECKSFLKAMGKVLAPLPQTAIVSHAVSGRVAQIHVKIGD